MAGKVAISRWLAAFGILAMAEGATVAAIEFSLTAPAQAQFFGDDRRPRPQRGGGFFDGLFGPSTRQYVDPDSSYQQGPADSSRAPSPRKPDANAPAPTTSIVVLGDGMADWLAYGLEDAFSDTPDVGILRKNKIHSGLLRYEAKSEIDWWHAARDILAPEKPSYVIMMLGISDRQNISGKDLAKEADKKKETDKKEADKTAAKDQPAKADADKNAPAKDTAPDKDAEDPDQASIIAPEPQGKLPNGTIEFRTDKWAEVYSRRIDDTIAALKSKGVPVFWVGLPSIKGTRSTADAVYLNDLYRARAEKAGAIYIDVWDGFVDEGGKFTTNGPDYEGQMRRLRSGDGVYFTKYGARKLAHYVERELRRYMSNRSLQVSLPSGPVGPLPADGKSAARPLAGPVVPLTVTPGNSDELLGGSGTSSAHGDALASRVLVKGESVPAPAGRADDFGWPRGGDPTAQPTTPVASLPSNPTSFTEPPAPAGNKAVAKPADEPKSKRQRAENPRPPRNVAPPPQPRAQSGPFGWLR
jgi:hypothetical protein